MRVIVSPEAIADLASISAYVGARSPKAASALVDRLSTALDSLDEMASRGRPGLVAGTRELANVWPYVIVYEVLADRVNVLRVRHSAQDRSRPS